MRSATEALDRAMMALPHKEAPIAILRIGMDDFRIVNETFGHAVGDEVLNMAEMRLQAAIREHEVVVRLPGDEFVVLLHSVTSVIRAGAAADRLIDLVRRVYFVETAVVNVTASVGIALTPEDGRRAEILLKRAGTALHCAKAAGTGMVHFFEPAMEEGRRRRVQLAPEMRPAFSLS